MDIRQLEVLLAVAEHGSFSGAARRLHTVQSNVSTHVARLEQELGSTLVDRATGHLTPEGAAVAARARRIQGELDAISPDLAAMHDEIMGTVRIGLIETAGRWLLPRLLRQQQQIYPRLHLHVVGATTTSLTPRVVEGGLHLAVVNLPASDPELDSVPLFDEARVLAVSKKNPLAERDCITLAELADIDLMVAPQGASFRDEIDAILRDSGIVLAPRAEVDSMGLLIAVVEAGDSAALMSASALPPKGSVTGVPVAGLAPRSVGLVSNRLVPPSATTRAVVSLVRDIVDVELGRRPGLSAPDPGDESPS